MKRFVAVYSRYFDVKTEEFDSFSEATQKLKIGEEAGSIYAHGVYDTSTKTAYVSDHLVVGLSGSDLSEGGIRALAKAVGVERSELVIDIVKI